MKKITHIIITSYIIFAAQASSAALLTFDDVAGGSIQDATGNMPPLEGLSTYQGYTFSSTLDWIDVERETSSFNFGAHSGDFALVNNESGIGIIDAGGLEFTFDGLWAKEYGTAKDSVGEDTLLDGTLSGFNNGELIWSVETNLNGSYEFYAAQAGLIDELHLGFGNLFLVDDIQLNAVPVPPAVWLFGSGLIGLIGVARRKTQA